MTARPRPSQERPKASRSGVAYTVYAAPGCGHKGYSPDERRNLCPEHWAEEAKSIDRELAVAEADYLEGRF